jgi:hypothetical protein
MEAQKKAMQELAKTEAFQDASGKGMITGILNTLELQSREFKTLFKRELENEEMEMKEDATN